MFIGDEAITFLEPQCYGRRGFFFTVFMYEAHDFKLHYNVFL